MPRSCILLSVALLSAACATAEPPPLEPALARLAAAWSEGPAAVAELAAARDRERVTKALGRAFQQRAWLGGRPPLEPVADVESVSAEGRRATLGLAGEPLTTRWRLAPEGWQLEDLELPLAGLDERVLGAWSSGDPRALAPFLRNVGAVEDLRAALARRGWERLPAVSGHVLEGEGEAALLRLSTAEGELRLTLRREGPVWLLEWELPPS